MAYQVEKELQTPEGEKVWAYEGSFDDPVRLATACFHMGKLYSNMTDIRITEEPMGKICEMVYTGDVTERTLLAHGIYKGLDYYVLSLGSHPCAYVDCKNYLINEDDIECHGGVTYHADHLHLPLMAIEGNFIGWDYSHYYDYTRYDGASGVSSFWPGEKHTTDEMIADCINVIKQIVEVDDAENKE